LDVLEHLVKLLGLARTSVMFGAAGVQAGTAKTAQHSKQAQQTVQQITSAQHRGTRATNTSKEYRTTRQTVCHKMLL
jgi:hypothetical protein